MKVDRKKPYKVNTLIAMVLVLAMTLTGCTLPNPREDKELSYRMAGIHKYNDGQYQEAIKLFQKSLDNSNGRISDVEIDICYYKAKALMNVGRNEEAMEVYNAIIDYSDKYLDAFLLRGNLYASLGELDKAYSDYDRVLKMNATNLINYITIYKNLVAVDDKQHADSYLNKALVIKPETVDSYLLMGQIQLLLENYDQAKAMFGKAENAGSEEAKLYMARVLELDGDKDAAYSIYEAYVNKHDKDAEALLSLVKILIENEDYENSLPYIEEALEVSDFSAKKELMTYKIMAQEKLHMLGEALESVNKYLKDYPDDERMQKEKTFLETRK